MAAQVGAAVVERFLGGGVLPHFADEQLVLAVGFDGGTDLFDKIIRQFIRHIQPEAGSPQPQPCINHATLAADKVAVRGVLLFHFGQGLKAPPAAVAADITGIEVIPAAVGRIAVTVSAAGAIAAFAVKIERIRTGVAEHAIQNNADAVFFGLGAQGGKILVGAQQWIGFQVVGRIVAVVGVSLKNGVQVNAGNTQLFQVRQLLLDARKIAAVIVHVQVAIALLIGPKIRLAGFIRTVNAVRKGQRLVGYALIKAVREDLVHRTVFDPVWGLEVRLVHRQLPIQAIHPGQLTFPVGGAINLAEIRVQVKVVKIQSRCGGGQLEHKMVYAGGLAVKIHAVMHGVFAVFGQHQVWVHIAQSFRHSQPPGNGLPRRNCAKRCFILRTAGVKKSMRWLFRQTNQSLH